MSAPNIASGTEPARMTKGSRKLLNWAASTRKIRMTARAKAGQELVPLGAQLARLAGVVEDIPLGQDLCRLVLQEAQGLIQRPHRHAADLDRVELLEAVERAGHHGFAKRGDGGERDQFSVRAGDIDVLQLVRVEAVDPLDLRNDLVAAPGDVEAVDEIAADHGRQVCADLLQVEPEVGDLVAVDDELGLGLVDLDVDQRRKGEHAALHRLQLQSAGQTRGSARSRPWRPG